MTRSARKRAQLATLATSTLSADRQKAVSDYKRARKKVLYSFRKSLANPDSAVLSALSKDACIFADEARWDAIEARWDAIEALSLESAHYSYKCKPAKARRLS